MIPVLKSITWIYYIVKTKPRIFTICVNLTREYRQLFSLNDKFVVELYCPSKSWWLSDWKQRLVICSQHIWIIFQLSSFFFTWCILSARFVINFLSKSDKIFIKWWKFFPTNIFTKMTKDFDDKLFTSKV